MSVVLKSGGSDVGVSVEQERDEGGRAVFRFGGGGVVDLAMAGRRSSRGRRRTRGSAM